MVNIELTRYISTKLKGCSSFFSVDMIKKYLNKKELRGEEFILPHSSKLQSITGEATEAEA